MRTATSLLAALALTACGATAPEYALETQGIARDLTTPDVTLLAPEFDDGVAIVTIESIPRVDAPDFPDNAIEVEEEPREEGPEEQGPAGQTDFGRMFDPDGYCEIEPAARACPPAEAEAQGEVEISERQLEQLAALNMACESWLARGPASYAMDITEMRANHEAEEVVEIDATVCNGATVDAFDVGEEKPLDPMSVASIDNLFWAAADHVIAGEEITVRVDPNLSYITRLTVVTDDGQASEMFETTALLRPIGPGQAD